METVIMDFNRPDTLRAALNGIDCVFLVGPVAMSGARCERTAGCGSWLP
jgi:uncharacterized protein YbjT (DUF2867 family)